MMMALITGAFGLAVIGIAATLIALSRRQETIAVAPDAQSAAQEAAQDRLWNLAEAEERYRSLVEATMEVVVQRDAKGRITFANEGFAALLGQSPIELIGATIEPQVLEQGETVVRPDGVRLIDERVLPVDGVPRWYSFIEMPVAGNGAGPNWLRAGRDVTARIESARSLDEAKSRAEAANVAKSRFIATVSHEFRTPLNGILGMAALMRDTPLDAEQRTYVEAIDTSGRALLSLVDGILDFSRIEAGRIDLAAEPFDLVAVVEGVVELLAPRAQDKGLEIALDIAEDFSAMRVGDADRVRQILLNLAGNAIKFTQEGGVGVTLSQSEGVIVLAIEDTGPGMAEDRIPVLFGEFEQGDGSASRRHEGTGLGLAITTRLVERMKGRIEAKSKLGAGSVFRVVLPLAVADGAGFARTSMPTLDDRKVLIVAKSPFQAPYLARRLGRAGASAMILDDVEAGIAALSHTLYDAVIADRSLGDTAVRALAAEARRFGVRCSLILLSPFDRREFGAPGAAGFDSYLIKPVRARSLFDRLLEPLPAESRGREEDWVAARRIGLNQPARVQRPNRRVLLAEDNAINALLASKALERLGAEVVLARDGVEALAKWETEGPFDLGLIDIRMPGLDGLETARRIRSVETEQDLVPLRLVALTANTGEDDEQAALAAGFDGFLPKPLDLRALPALLETRKQAA